MSTTPGPRQVETVEEAMRELPDHLLDWIAHRSRLATQDLPAAAAAELERRSGCPWTAWFECALERERAVAGTDTPPRPCAVHPDPESEPEEEPFADDPDGGEALLATLANGWRSHHCQNGFHGVCLGFYGGRRCSCTVGQHRMEGHR